MRKALSLLVLFALLLGASGALAEELVFADLRALAPEGTFLAPGSAPEITDTTYRSENIAITITKQRVHDSDVYIADIYVTSVEHLRRGFSNGVWDENSQPIGTIAQANNAILGMTGDYSRLLSKGLVVGNGEVLRKSNNNVRDNCLIYPDGTMVTYKRGTKTVSELLAQPLWQSFLFGPSLLKSDGSPYEKFSSNIGAANPRSVLGYYAPGHYCFVLVDGRSSENRGIKMTPLSAYMAELGCQAAYNLDGGQSAILWFNGRAVNQPYNGGRPLTDIVYIGE